MASDKELGQLLGAGALLGASDRERILGLDNAAQQKATEYREYAKQVRERYKKQRVARLAEDLLVSALQGQARGLEMNSKHANLGVVVQQVVGLAQALVEATEPEEEEEGL